ncbi:MAG: ABC transporter permease [Gemmatimonadales bacterium]
MKLLTTFRAAVAEIWSRHELLEALIRRDLTLRYREAVMGVAWAVLLPMLTVGAGLAVRMAMGVMVGRAAGAVPIGAIAVKAVPWAFVVATLNFTTASLVANGGLIGKIWFPREVVPLAVIGSHLVDLGVGAAVVALMGPWLGLTLAPSLLAIPLLLLCLILLVFAFGLILSCLNLLFRDVKYLVQTGLTFAIFVTPVLYDPPSITSRLGLIVYANPVSALLQGIRIAAIDGRWPWLDGPAWNPWLLAWPVGLTIVLLPLAVLIFRRASTRFAELV